MSELPRYDPSHPEYDELQRLIMQMREGSNEEALLAVDELREKKWLTDGSMLDANLWGAKLRGADLRYADLRDVDLRNADLRYSILCGADFRGAMLWEVDLRQADLTEADLREATPNNANLSHAKLDHANLNNVDIIDSKLTNTSMAHVDLGGATLAGADLEKAFLRGANLSYATLASVDLSGADLSFANLTAVHFLRAVLSEVTLRDTELCNVDLSLVSGLDTIVHRGPSFLDYQTLAYVQGRLPLNFLQGVGFSDTYIEYLPYLFDTPIQYYKAFVSYSHADQEFAKHLHKRLQGEGIRCWIDDEDMKIGDKVYDTINQAIQIHDKVILICSEHSLKSRWVKREFETMLQQEEDHEKANGKFVPLLLPLDVDGYIFKEAENDYMVTEIKSRLAADFTNWKDHDAFEAAFDKLVKALKVKR